MPMLADRTRVSFFFVTLALLCGASGCAERSLLAVRESGDSHMEYKEYDAAIKDYEEYLQRAPGNAEVRSSLSKAYLATGQSGMAREQSLVAQAIRVEDDAIFATTANTLYQDKRFEELNKLLRQRTVDRGRMQDFLLLANYSEKQGDVDEAQRAFLTAAKVSGGARYEPHLGLARLYRQVGDKRRARERLAMAYFVAPNEQEVVEEVRKANEVPGPTFGVTPPELSNAEPN